MQDNKDNKDNVIDIEEELKKFEQGFSYKKSKKQANLNELIFVRLIDPVHIPTYLVEQIKDREYEVDKFYDYQRLLCLQQTTKGPELNASNFLYALVNDKIKQVKGFLWATIDFLTNCLIINNFSVDREYWFQGQAIDLLEKKAKQIKKDLGLSKIVWITSHPRLCENRGFKRTKDAVMVYEGD